MKTTTQELQQILKLNSQGDNNKMIHTKLNIPIPTIRYWLKRMKLSGIEVKKPKSPGRPKLDLSTILPSQ